MKNNLKRKSTVFNFFKVLFVKVIIISIFYPWRILEKILRKNFGARSHYYIMMVFRSLFKSFWVTVQYQNKVIKEPQPTLRLNLDLCQNSQQWYFRYKGKYDLEELKLVSMGMESADVFVDVGSSIGIYALTIAQAYPQKKVIAVEPLEGNYLSLKNHITINSLPNIEALNAAVSDSRDGKVVFYPNPIHDGGGSLIKKSFYRTGDIIADAGKYQIRNETFRPEVTIKAVKLDDLITLKSVIKIDVEGAEVDVIRSGSNVFRNGLIDMMIVEVLDETIDDAVSLLNDAGFDCFLHDLITPVKVGSRLNHFVGNIICLRRGFLLHK